MQIELTEEELKHLEYALQLARRATNHNPSLQHFGRLQIKVHAAAGAVRAESEGREG